MANTSAGNSVGHNAARTGTRRKISSKIHEPSVRVISGLLLLPFWPSQ